MKKRAAMGGVQMFSFLDAMICTLGALLVLLHAFARHGQTELVRKAEEQAKAASQSGEDLKIELELLQWRVEELRKVRAKTEAQLADERLRLSHVEDHHRKLQDKLEELKLAAEKLKQVAESGKNKQLRDLAALEAARIRLREARAAVDQAQQRSQQAANYSVVPYEGANATRRRPIYIECRDNTMILQPEGVELVPEDFAGFLGPGNPLASALRGTREYYARGASPDEPDAEPYPLLLVRPEGVGTYYAALAALDSWGSEFGYELIGSDWKLKFTEPDERLAGLLRQIVADARQRMRQLMLATAELRSRRPRATLRASSSGGFVVENGPSRGGYGRSRRSRGGGWDSLDSDWLRGGSSSSARGTGSAITRRGGDSPGGPAAHSDRPLADGANGRGHPGGQFANADGDSPYDQAIRRESSGDSLAAHPGTGGGAITNGPRPGPGGATAEPTTGQPGQPNPSAGGTGERNGTESATAGASSTSGNGTAQADHPWAGSHANAASAGGAASGSGSPHGTASDGNTSGASSSVSAGAQPSHGQQAQQCQTCSIAGLRGRGWALPDSAGDLTGVTRPILVQCHPDRLVIVPDTRGQQRQVTQLSTSAQDDMDEFVSNVWQHTRNWGIAGRGLYWRPTLVIDVAPGAAERYAEIETLLTDSGLDVRRRRAQTVAQPPAAGRTPTR